MEMAIGVRLTIVVLGFPDVKPEEKLNDINCHTWNSPDFHAHLKKECNGIVHANTMPTLKAREQKTVFS